MEKIKAILPKGFVDKNSQQIAYENYIQNIISEVYQLYGFFQIDTPIIEYSVALGKFLPDIDRPNEGVFALRDEDENWLSLRYDLTAPLARYVAANYESLVKPFRAYRVGPVFRNEKPGMGRFRQFIQFDADIIGTNCPSSDIEICMMAADIFKKLGLKPDQYVIKLNNRKLLDALLQKIKLCPEKHADIRLNILRSIDKFDKFGAQGVAQLLGKGRLDESGDFTKGVGLPDDHIELILRFLQLDISENGEGIGALTQIIGGHELAIQAIDELQFMQRLIEKSGYSDRIKIDFSVVRGLDYYTGAVFEAELLFDIVNNDGIKVVFGSVGGGGRYDNLVSRFNGAQIGATGFSLGVSRLVTALQALDLCPKSSACTAPVIILKMDKDIDSVAGYQKIAKLLRDENIACEIYAASSGMKAQMKYADRIGAPCVIIQGANERQEDVVQIKDLAEGLKLSSEIKDNSLWRESRPAQVTVKTEDIVSEVKKILANYT